MLYSFCFSQSSCRAVVQWYKQGFNNDAVEIQNISIITNVSLCLWGATPTSLPLSPLPALATPNLCFSVLISRMLCQWNHTFLDWLFSFNIIFWRSSRFLHVSKFIAEYSKNYCMVFHGLDIPVCLTIHLLKDIWVGTVFSFMNKAATTTCTNFMYENKISFLWDKCQRVQLLSHMAVACLVF